MLTQWLGPWKLPVAYLSTKLDPVDAGWPACIWRVKVLVVLVKDAHKLTLGQNLTMTAPHAWRTLFNNSLNDSLSDYVAKLRSGDLHVTSGPQASHSTAQT